MQICESLSSTRGVRRKGRSSPNLLHKTTVAACLRHDAPSHCLHWCKMQNADIRFASLQTFANPARPYPDYKLRLLTHKKNPPTGYFQHCPIAKFTSCTQDQTYGPGKERRDPGHDSADARCNRHARCHATTSRMEPFFECMELCNN